MTGSGSNLILKMHINERFLKKYIIWRTALRQMEATLILESASHSAGLPD